MDTGGAIPVIAGVAAVVLVALALLGVVLPHDPDAQQSWTLYPSYWSGHLRLRDVKRARLRLRGVRLPRPRSPRAGRPAPSGG